MENLIYIVWIYLHYDHDTNVTVFAGAFTSPQEAELRQRQIIEQAEMIKSECPKEEDNLNYHGDYKYWEYQSENENWLAFDSCIVKEEVLNPLFNFKTMTTL